MIQLKLIKGLSYRGGKGGCLQATKSSPLCLVNDMEEAAEAVETGYFQIIGEIKATVSTVKDKSISEMSKDELIQYAKEHDIDIAGCKTNEERKATINAALSSNDTQVEYEEE